LVAIRYGQSIDSEGITATLTEFTDFRLGHWLVDCYLSWHQCYSQYRAQARDFISMQRRNWPWHILKDPSPYRAVNTLRLGYTNQSVNAV